MPRRQTQRACWTKRYAEVAAPTVLALVAAGPVAALVVALVALVAVMVLG